MEREKIDRINELGRIAKNRELTPEETEERQKLREEYILDFRAGLRGILDNTYIEYPDGSRKKVEKKD